MSQRKQKKVAEALREAVSSVVLFEMNDPRLGFVTITQVEVSRDLRSAKVKFSTMGQAPDRSKAVHCLQHASGHIREQIGKRLRMRHVPTLRFELDESIQRGMEVRQLIEEARRQDTAEQ